MILRGLLMLAKGDKAGLNEFSNSLESFTASLAPLIAFPLVGAGISVAAGQWQIAIIGFLSRGCAVLVLPVMTYEFARRFGRESLWPRTATALNWSFWMVVPMIFISAFAGALMVQAGLTPLQAITAATGENAKLLHASDRGTIAPGKRADLLVLDADPLVDIGNTEKIFAVYHDGHNIVDLPGRMK